jgi:hypothetical protein
MAVDPIEGCGDALVGLYFNLRSASDVVNAVNQGWGGVADPGGAGSTSPPYTVANRGSDGNTQDQYVQNAYAQVGNRFWWMSFWTCDWPNQSLDTFSSAGQKAGAAAATAVQATFGAYKPVYLVADLGEGGGNPPPTSSTQFIDYINGFVSGAASVNGLIRAGFYTNQSSYQSFSLGSILVPAFIAVSPILNNAPGVTGPNIHGFIAYYAGCPAGQYVNQVKGWHARWNTVQFSDSAFDCGPSP